MSFNRLPLSLIVIGILLLPGWTRAGEADLASSSQNGFSQPGSAGSGQAGLLGGNADIDDELDQLLDQDISSLRRTSVAPALDVEVSTVSRQQSTIGRSPAAVFVIDEEMIRRSGARRLPDLLDP